MANETPPNPVPKIVAVLVVSVYLAWLMRSRASQLLVRLDTAASGEPPPHEHAHLRLFLWLAILGGVYVAVVEAIAFVVRMFTCRKPPA